jgi:hypothetical protein
MKEWFDKEDSAGTVFAQAALLYVIATFFLVIAAAKSLGIK